VSQITHVKTLGAPAVVQFQIGRRCNRSSEPPESSRKADLQGVIQARRSRGLEMANATICDAHTVALSAFPRQIKAIVFPMHADSMRDELRRYSDAPYAL
jgi:hypothetical protein